MGMARPKSRLGVPRLTVFESDLTTRWSISSGQRFSGVSAFDFDGDGQSEILYSTVFNSAGRQWFYIRRGSDGAILYRRITNHNIDDANM